VRHVGRDSAGRSVVTSTLLILTCLVLGLLAGGMLVIGVSLVSFWKSLAPGDFQAWFAAHAHLVGRLMIPRSRWPRSSPAGEARRQPVAGSSSRRWV
jgi:hypothetical protein